MSPLLNKFIERIFRDRIKPFVIIEGILLIPIIYIAWGRLMNIRNYTYYGYIVSIILSVIYFLMGIESFILKKKASSLFYFILGVFFILMETYFYLR